MTTEPTTIYGLFSAVVLALIGYLKWRHGKKSNVQVILEKQIDDLKKEVKVLNKELKRVSPTRNKLKK